MSPTPVQLHFTRDDWWRRHGLVNIAFTVVGLLFFLVPVGLGTLDVFIEPTLLTEPTLLLFAVVGLLVFAVERSVVWSLYAVLFRRPHLTVGQEGVTVDGGPLDRWCFRWSQIEAMAPGPSSLKTALGGEGFVAITLRVTPAPARRPFSSVQHSMLPDIIEVSGYLKAASQSDLERLLAYIDDAGVHMEPFLVSDWGG